METQIKPIDKEHIAIIETHTDEQLIAKATLEAQKAEYTTKIAEIDDLLTYFVETPK